MEPEPLMAIDQGGAWSLELDGFSTFVDATYLLADLISALICSVRTSSGIRLSYLYRY
jgi:hypothetical protein